MSSVPTPPNTTTPTPSSTTLPPVPASESTAIIHYKPRRSICCTLYRDGSDFQNILQEIGLTHVQKEIIKLRYLRILENLVI